MYVADVTSGLGGHSLKLFKPRCRTTIRQNFFSLRIVNEWNKLRQDVVEAPSTNTFKNRLGRHWQDIWAFKADSYIAHHPQVTSMTETAVLVSRPTLGNKAMSRRLSRSPARTLGSTTNRSADITSHNITYSFIANCQTAVVHNNKTKRVSKIYKSQCILRYNILTVKLQSVIREMRSGSCLL